jgi:hypothetical protein
MWKIYDLSEEAFLSWPDSNMVLLFPTEDTAQSFIALNLLDEEHRFSSRYDSLDDLSLVHHTVVPQTTPSRGDALS